MSLDPKSLEFELDKLEEIEKATVRLVTQAICDFRNEAQEIFHNESDLAGDMGEDITREAMDNLGVSRIPIRLFGKVDYKRARYVFFPDFSIKQALFVDSKAEKITGKATATLQTSQISMRIRQVRHGEKIDELGKLPTVIESNGEYYLTSTVFVKYHYEALVDGKNRLINIIIASLPNGMLQDRYNPNEKDTIWLAGRDAPTLGEEFRVRLSFERLKRKKNWRVQCVTLHPTESYQWDN